MVDYIIQREMPGSVVVWETYPLSDKDAGRLFMAFPASDEPAVRHMFQFGGTYQRNGYLHCFNKAKSQLKIYDCYESGKEVMRREVDFRRLFAAFRSSGATQPYFQV